MTMIRAMLPREPRAVTTSRDRPRRAGRYRCHRGRCTLQQAQGARSDRRRRVVRDRRFEQIRPFGASIPCSRVVTTLATFAATPHGPCPDGLDLLVSLSTITPSCESIRTAASCLSSGQSGSSGLVDGVGDAARLQFPGGNGQRRRGNDLPRRRGQLRGSRDRSRRWRRAHGGRRHLDGHDGRRRLASPLFGASRHRFRHRARVRGRYGQRDDSPASRFRDRCRDDARRPRSGDRGRRRRVASDARFNQPQGLAPRSGGARPLRCRRRKSGDKARSIFASGVVGTLALVAAPGELLVRFDAPAGTRLLDRGRLYVTDPSADTLTAIDVAERPSIDPRGDLAPGRNGGWGRRGGHVLQSAVGVASDGRGGLYVADSYNHTLRHVDVATRAVTTARGRAAHRRCEQGRSRRRRAPWVSPRGYRRERLRRSTCPTRATTPDPARRLVFGAVTTPIGSPSLSGVRLGQLPAQITLPSAVTVAPSGEVLLVSENAVLVAR